MEMGPFLISVIIRKDEINKALRWKKTKKKQMSRVYSLSLSCFGKDLKKRDIA